MAHRLTSTLVLILSLTACTGEEGDRTPLTPTTPVPATPSGTNELLSFLRAQGGNLADVLATDLPQLDAIRLDRDYATDQLALLAGLPSLRDAMIWRDGEGRPGSQRAPAPTDADLRQLASLAQLETLRIGGWRPSSRVTPM